MSRTELRAESSPYFTPPVLILATVLYIKRFLPEYTVNTIALLVIYWKTLPTTQWYDLNK